MVQASIEYDFRDSSWGTRQKAIVAATRAKDRSLLPQIRKLLEDPYVNVRSTAACALAAMKDPEGAQFVRQRLTTEQSPEVLKELIVTLGFIGTPQDINAIQPYLSNKSSVLRSSAVNAITKLDTISGKLAALEALSDPDWVVRIACCQTLIRCASDDPIIINHLTELVQSDPSDRVRMFLGMHLGVIS